MTQNRSTAVMQRRVEAHDSLDDFPTPPWATRALCEFLGDEGFDLSAMSCREPAANRGHMVKPLFEAFGHVLASDVHDYGAGFKVRDYLFGPIAHLDRTDWTITNPPFRLAEQFIERALALSHVGVAMIVRTAFLEGVGRFERLFSAHQPAHVLQFSERVVMHKGKLTATGSTATAYCWIIWRPSTVGKMAHPHARFGWIAPCRKRLERAGDYPVATDQAA
ncbi:methyltransferase [Sphingomonas soli]|uniref:methyltransferase n=1 Tax=Sphingomonas soli TaxID=266127 RepID=UPI0009FE0B23|nr:methyltransferase [Sphingomonas soli]